LWSYGLHHHANSWRPPPLHLQCLQPYYTPKHNLDHVYQIDLHLATPHLPLPWILLIPCPISN
jgi:hypothetical protein